MSIEEEAREKADAAYRTATPNPSDPFNPAGAFRHGFEQGYIAGASRPVEAAPSDTDHERIAQIMARVTPLGHASALALVKAETKMLEQANITRATSQPVQVTPEALAAKLYSIEYQVDPDSATTDDVDERLGAADDLIAWFAEHAPSQPVHVEVTDMADSIRDRHYAVEIEPSDTICGACSMRLPNGKYFGKLVEWPCDAVQLATALGGGE